MGNVNRFGMATFACVFNRDLSKVLMIRRNEEKRKKYGFEWGIIGGKIEFGEHSQDAVLREIREEIGLDIPKESAKFLYVKEVPNWFDVAHVAFFIYFATIDENSGIVVNEESDGYEWFDVSKLPESRSSDDDIEGIRDMARKAIENGN